MGSSLPPNCKSRVIPEDQAELDGFLARTGDQVIGNDAVPEAPAGSGIQVRPEFRLPGLYVVRVDPGRFDLAGFTANARKSGLTGATVFSSDSAARLLAGVVREKAGGLRFSPNFVGEGGALFSTRENPTGVESYQDALTYRRFFATESRASILPMYQLVAAQPRPCGGSGASVQTVRFWSGDSRQW